MKYKKGDLVIRTDAGNEGQIARIKSHRSNSPDNSSTYYCEELTGITLDRDAWWNDKYFRKCTKLERVLK